MKWGLTPQWLSKPSKNTIINARNEKILQKKSFYYLARRNRCLIPANGFYEWKKNNNRKDPYLIRHSKSNLIAFAGVWDEYKLTESSSLNSSKPVQKKRFGSFLILTRVALPSISYINERMPVIVEKGDFDLWLEDLSFNPIDDGKIKHIFNKEIKDIESFPVSNRVNKIKNNDSDCVVEINEKQQNSFQGELF